MEKLTTSPAQLTVAAIVDASAMAIAAFFIHGQVLEFLCRGYVHCVDHPVSGVRASSVGRLTPVSGRETAGIGEGDSDEEQTEGEEWAAYKNEDVVNRDLHSSTASHDGANNANDQKESTFVGDQKTTSELLSNGKKDAAATPATGIVPFFTNALLSLRTIIQGNLDTAYTEEEEVCRMLRYCLDLREAYLYKESVAPSNKEKGSPSTERKMDPYEFVPVGASSNHCQMGDCVVRVYASKTELYPVANATDCFTDLHHILRIMSVGNTSSA